MEIIDFETSKIKRISNSEQSIKILANSSYKYSFDL